MSLCQCYHTSDTDRVLTFFECLCTIFLCLSSHRIATVSLVSVTLARESAAIFTLAALYWRLCGRNVYRETGAECCVQLELMLLCRVLAGEYIISVRVSAEPWFAA